MIFQFESLHCNSFVLYSLQYYSSMFFQDIACNFPFCRVYLYRIFVYLDHRFGSYNYLQMIVLLLVWHIFFLDISHNYIFLSFDFYLWFYVNVNMVFVLYTKKQILLLNRIYLYTLLSRILYLLPFCLLFYNQVALVSVFYMHYNRWYLTMYVRYK